MLLVRPETYPARKVEGQVSTTQTRLLQGDPELAGNTLENLPNSGYFHGPPRGQLLFSDPVKVLSGVSGRAYPNSNHTQERTERSNIEGFNSAPDTT